MKMLPLLPVGVAYVNHGPVTMRTDAFLPETFAASVAALRAEYVDRRGLQLRIAAPQGGAEYNSAQTACLAEQGFRLSNEPHSLETFIVDLNKPLGAIRSGLDRKWSASLRRAEQSNIVITRTQDPADFERFEALYDGIVERKGFFARQGARFFSDVSRRAPASDRIFVHLAWHENEPVAGHIGSFVGDTALAILAAAGPRGREVCASFALWWATVEYALETGNRYYDLGGIDQRENPDVYRFKKRFGGRHVTSAGNFEIAPGRSQKMLIDTAEQAWTYLRSAKVGLAKWRTGSMPAQ
ncbi:GNAT family N-acetyltransferase [Methylobacterium sp. C25]|nr:GNAT family N-acetyltransferase [Methylobacterium sp. C25]